jgi:hypothetical protein
MTRRVHFSAGLRWLPTAGVDHVHQASAGGGKHALDAREVLAAILKEFGQGHTESLRYLAKGLRTWVKMPIFNP